MKPGIVHEDIESPVSVENLPGGPLPRGRVRNLERFHHDAIRALGREGIGLIPVLTHTQADNTVL